MMKRMSRTISVLLCSVALAVGTVGVVSGCRTSQSRAVHNTLGGLGQAVDIAEREYMDGVIYGAYKTNDFPRIQAGYSAFQGAYKLAVVMAMGSTNIPPTAELSRQAAQLISDINAVKGK